MNKTQQKLTDKLVELGGPGALDALQSDLSTSETEDEAMSPTTRANRRRLKEERAVEATITTEGG